MDYYERKGQKMIRIKNSDFIKIFENDKTISRIGKIDMNVINDNSIYSLYYKFPLIERIILEIYRLIPRTNIEQYEQGTMKTINSIINNNKKINIIYPELKKMIDNYFNESDDSPRNVLFHPRGKEIISVTVNFEEINEIIAKLLGLLNHVIEEYKISSLPRIKKI